MDDDRAAHFRHMTGDICKAAALAELTLMVLTHSGRSVQGVASCRPGEPEALLRVGDIELRESEVDTITVIGPLR